MGHPVNLKYLWLFLTLSLQCTKMQIVYFQSALLLFVLCEIARIKRSCSSCFCCGLKIVTNKVRVKTTWCPNKFWIEISKPSKIRICPKKSSNFHDFFVFGDFLLNRPKLVGTPCVDLETANNCTDFSPICLLVKIPSKKYVRMMINDDDDAEKKQEKWETWHRSFFTRITRIASKFFRNIWDIRLLRFVSVFQASCVTSFGQTPIKTYRVGAKTIAVSPLHSERMWSQNS